MASLKNKFHVLGLLCLALMSVSTSWAQAPRATPEENDTAVSASVTPAPGYRLRKGDKLSIKFTYQPELSEPTLTVRPDGFISLQLIDDVKAEGLTTTELRQKLESAYSEILVQPAIAVSVAEFMAPRVFVGGQVQKPGVYELRGTQTILQAVLSAGGFTREAQQKMVLRARPAGDGQLQVTVVDIAKLLRPGGTGQDLPLQDGDYVFVPETKLSKITHIVSAFQALVPGYRLFY